MWLFTKHGHISLVKHETKPDSLVVYAQVREDIDGFITLLGVPEKQEYEVQEVVDGDYRFAVEAKRAAVAEAVSRMINEIDYGRFMRSVHIDFGKEPGYLLWLNPTGLQVSRVKPE